MVFDLFKFVLHLMVRQDRKENERRLQKLHELFAGLHSRQPMSIEPAIEEQVIEYAQRSAQACLSHPETAKFTDISAQQRSSVNRIVCGVVDSKNREGQTMRNYFLAEIAPNGETEFCEMLETDPRQVHDPSSGSQARP